MWSSIHTAPPECIDASHDTGGRYSEGEQLFASSFGLAVGRGVRDRRQGAHCSINNLDRSHLRRAERTACEPHSGW
jgi:hypothetical protein